MKKVLRTKNNNKIKGSTLSITKYPYLLTTYNKNYNTPKNIRSNKSYHNHSHYKMTISDNNTYSLYNPDEEYVTKLNFFNIGGKNDKKNKNKITLYNLNTVPVFPSILKKDTDNVESFKEKKRILNELNLKQTVFDKVNNAENSKQTYVNRYENTFKENQLEKERKEIERKIIKLKEMIKSLSKELSITIKEIDNLKLDVDIMQNFRSYNLFNSNQMKNNINDIKDENYKRRKSITNKENEIDKEKEKDNKFKIEMMLLSNSEKVFKIKQEMKTKLKELEDKKVLLLDKIDICENELKKFKETYHNIKEELLVHYHRLLAEGKDTRKEGLSWIILAIWNLKSNVLLSYLPKFLDQNIILFLFEYSSLLKKIKETEKKIRELALKLKDQKEYIKNNSNNLSNLNIFNREDNYKNYIYRNNNNEDKIKNEIENKNNNEDEDNEEEEREEEEEEEEEDEENENKEVDNKAKKEKIENNEIIKEDANENNVSNTKSIIINNESKINKKNNKSKLNETEKNINEKKEKEKEKNDVIDNNNKMNNIKEERKNDINLQTQFGETFKTSLYNTNSDKRENNGLFFDKKNLKKEDENIEKHFSEIKEKKKIKDGNNIINNISSNFFKSLFKKEDLYKKDRDIDNKEKKIKLNDFKNIYNNNNRNSLLFDYKTFELFNEHKNMEKYCSKLKEKAELLMKKELDRVSKSFYLYDYGGKYNVDQRIVISALVGEDSVRSELIKQKKEEKEYFKTLRELRNGKISQKN